MELNPLATELNQAIEQASPTTWALMSDLGRRLYFPKGILSQSAEAKEKAHKFNATIGTATEQGKPMHLACTMKYFNLPASEVYPYAPPAGRPGLRQAWAKKQEQDNPSMRGKAYSLPVVTSAITHGLSLVGDLFINPGDIIISPDQLWGNYRLTYETRLGAKIVTFPLFQGQDLNVAGFAQVLAQQAQGRSKLVVLLNFPNNPTGYTPRPSEAQGLIAAMKTQAEAGTQMLALCDDSYFGLFYEDSIKESLFGALSDLHPNILGIKLDGATKEYYAWGFRTGFIRFGVPQGSPALYAALEKKAMGAIRGNISNCTQVSQAVTERLFDEADFPVQAAEKHGLLKARALKVKEVLNQAPFKDELVYYPFNSGYFMCLKFADLEAEPLRLHLLNQYGVGVIASAKKDIRVAFSCIEVNEVEELFTLILQAVRDLRKKA